MPPRVPLPERAVGQRGHDPGPDATAGDAVGPARPEPGPDVPLADPVSPAGAGESGRGPVSPGGAR
ncbi:hypothetical protein JCM4814A_58720 [Streptomyces phaeofaciens JCM 4814]|uniref:Uncharacterized protein n=1 Tax=Streptomyces phaeofaciens TaxID=68254 RepID=A0A918HLT8_9ACTN|nr:hypothetical protein GCM10010226_66150 [Streptomyces phaeofaciens]